MPVKVPTAAMAVLLLLQLPPPDTSDKVVARPTHTSVLPLTPTDVAVTVTTVVSIHPVPSEYVIVVVPAEMPVTTPL